MQWASTVTSATHLEDALDEALENLAADLGDAEPDLMLAFAHADYGDYFSRLGRTIRARYPDVVLIGCSADGVIGGGEEIEHQPALSLTAAALPDVTVRGFHLGDNPDEWREQIGAGADGGTSFLLLTEPLTCPTEELARWLDTLYPDSVKLGGVASGSGEQGVCGLFLGDRVLHSGAVGVALSGDIEIETVVAQGCRPIGNPMFATRVEDDILLELDGQTALSVIEDTYTKLATDDQELFRHSLFLGVVIDRDRQVYGRGDFLVRNIVGVEPQLGAVAVAAQIEAQQVVQFHLRDAETSTADLKELLAQCSEPAPAGALLFSCLGRGESLYGSPNHDSACFQRRFGEDIPIGGFFGNGEIGPVGRRTFVHGYTSAFGLFRPRRRS
ncbi:MAG: FIST C-terminal domain-containing protein [Haliangiales bacterium]